MARRAQRRTGKRALKCPTCQGKVCAKAGRDGGPGKQCRAWERYHSKKGALNYRRYVGRLEVQNMRVSLRKQSRRRRAS